MAEQDQGRLDASAESAYVMLAQRVHALELHREHETKLLQEIREGQTSLISKIENLVKSFAEAAGDQREYIHRSAQNENRLSAIEESRSDYIQKFTRLEANVESGFREVDSRLEDYKKTERSRQEDRDKLMNTLFTRWGTILMAVITVAGLLLKYSK